MSDELHDRIVEQQQRWHGWGSPVGLGLGFLFVASGLALLVGSVGLLAR